MVLMANCFAWLKNRKKPVRDVKLIIVGLDDAGKTTTVACLQGEPPDGITPTVGFSNAKLLEDRWNVTLYDLGGGSNVRAVWKKYYAEIYGIIFTVDSVNKERLVESKSVLCDIFEDPKVSGKPIIVFANKQDKEGALNKIEITQELDLQDLSQRYKFKFNVFPCSALKGYGKKTDQSIKAGFHWILQAIEEDYATIHEKVEKESAIQREEEAKERRERMERIRKLREEREKAAKEAGVQEEEEEEEENDDVVAGNPFRNISDQIKVTEKREKKAKEIQKKIKAYQENKGEETKEEIELTEERVKKKKKKKVKKKISKYEQDNDEGGEKEENDDEVNDRLKLPKITLKGATPDNSDNEEIETHRTINLNEHDSGLAVNFDDLKRNEKTVSKKKKKMKKSPKKNVEDFDSADGVDFKREVPRTNVIVVGSSENVKENDDEDEKYLGDDSLSKKVKKKKKKKKPAAETHGEDEDYQEDRESIQRDSMNELAKVNDSRAELFRARSHDSLDDVMDSEVRLTKKSKKKKTKKKEKTTSVSLGSEDDCDDDGNNKKSKKKKNNKNKTVPTACDGGKPRPLDSHDNDMLPPVHMRKLPPIRGNGHVSKLQPIELRGRLPDIGKVQSFNGQPSGSSW